MGGKIFVNYRRSDSDAHALSIAQYLEKEFGAARVFIDVDRIKAGQKFPVVLEEKLAQCAAMLAVIGPKWLDTRDDKSGQRRIDNPEDWVRLEIERALARGIAVIPVCVGGASLPPKSELPASLQPLVEHQAAMISTQGFRHEMAGLARDLRETAGRGLPLGKIAAALAGVAVIGALVLAGPRLGAPSSPDVARVAAPQPVPQEPRVAAAAPVSSEPPKAAPQVAAPQPAPEEPRVAAIAPPSAPAPAPSPESASGSFTDVKLTDALVESFLAAQGDFTPLVTKLSESSETIDPALKAQLESVAKKHGFKSSDHYMAVGEAISFVMGGLDAKTGLFTEPADKMRKEIEDIKADKDIPAADKKLAIEDLEKEVAASKPLGFRENIDVVKRHLASLQALMPN